ncbi:MAG TPA: hypothetical protein VE028_00210 [Nitratidesulfovibrio sp.]|nr:hypothetical protein [Nitratidesulfovibrio sp.]
MESVGSLETPGGAAAAAPETPTAPAAPETPTAPAAPAAPEAPAAPATPAAPDTPATPGSGHWSDSMPETWKEHLKGLETADAALDALRRGVAYTPAMKPEDVQITLPEGVEQDPAALDAYRKACVEQGLTPKQAQEMVNWHLANQREAQARQEETEAANLEKAWGPATEANRQKALGMFTTLDRRMGGRLAESGFGQAIASSAVAIETLHMLSELVSEDNIGTGSGAAAPQQPMSKVEFYNSMFPHK